MEYSSKDCLFAYQPILDRQHHPVALALLSRDSENGRAASTSNTLETARVVVNAYMSSELVELLGDRKIFVNVDNYFLDSGMASILPASKVVLELVHYEAVIEETTALCKEFRNMGYSFALDDYVPSEAMMPLLDVADIVKLDIQAMTRERLTEAVAGLRDKSVKLLAEKVESQEEFELCRALGFDLFQGYYFAHPKVLMCRRPDPQRTNILNILSLIGQDAGDRDVEHALKQSPDVALHLLRLVNSAAFGSRAQIGSMREALNLFGRSKLSKWLHLLLFMSEERGGIESALFEMAARRGRMIESLVLDVTHRRGSLQQDRGFMVGMLSLVDVLLGVPMEEILPQIGVIEEIQQAILTKSGTLGTLLMICESLEMADFDAVIEASGALRIPLARVMEAQREAILWTTTVAAGNPDAEE